MEAEASVHQPAAASDSALKIAAPTSKASEEAVSAIVKWAKIA
jgi:hypothetical protein